MKRRIFGFLFVLAIALPAYAQEDIDSIPDEDLIALGGELYHQAGSCVICHGDQAQGGIGPAFDKGPSPYDIAYQMQSNPQMAAVTLMLSKEGENLPSDADLFALTYYIQDLVGQEVAVFNRFELKNKLNELKGGPTGPELVFEGRDAIVEEITHFESVVDSWTRKAKEGPLKKTYQVTTAATYDAGEPKFTPEPGKTYFYENLDEPNLFYMPFTEVTDDFAQASAIVVGDAETREVVAYNEMPKELSGQVHTTFLTPDAKYVYITGPAAEGAPQGNMQIVSPASLLKVDALTLEPVKQMIVGARIHHGQLYQDKYLLIDTFARDPDGLDVFLLDPETDEIIGGIQCEDLGGSCYTSYNDGHHIYILMQPAGYGPPAFSGIIGGEEYVTGKRAVLRPYWVAKLDPETWEVLAEYPYPGYRGNWMAFDAEKKNAYIPAGGTSNVSKLNLETGAVEWAAGTGTGPYGASVTVDGNELWIADKGEVTGFRGRTVTVVDLKTGRPKHTLFSGYTVDHILLSPNGKEMWATSNGDATIHVFDVETYETKEILQMPGMGNPHGLVWVHYDEDGSGRVIRDQGGFHGGVDPLNGKPLDY